MYIHPPEPRCPQDTSPAPNTRAPVAPEKPLTPAAFSSGPIQPQSLHLPSLSTNIKNCRCVVCPCSYCEDHVPSEHHSGRVDLPDGCEELEELGYRQPASAYYIVCSYSCYKYYTAFKNNFEGYKEENRPDGKEHVLIDGEMKLVDKHQCACVKGTE
eukprot:1330629-Amorphochlora_amoeboformis.AAC.1